MVSKETKEENNSLILLNNISNVIEKIAIYCCVSLIAILLVIVLAQITLRWIGFSIPWTEELSRFLMIWAGLLGASVALKRGSHIGVELVVNMFPAKIKYVFSLVIKLIVIIFIIYFIKYGWDVAVKALRVRSPGLEILMFWPKLSLPVGGIIMLIQAVCLFLIEIFTGSKEKESSA